MSQSPTVSELIASIIRGTNARILLTDGTASRDIIIGMSSNSPVVGLPVGYGYIQTPDGNGLMIFNGTHVVLNLHWQGGISYLASSWAPDANEFYFLGVGSRCWAGIFLSRTSTPAATTGAQTINKSTGSVNFAAGATSLVVTCSYVHANSIIIATVATNDATMKSVLVVAGAGAFTLHANAAATAETKVNFLVLMSDA